MILSNADYECTHRLLCKQDHAKDVLTFYDLSLVVHSYRYEDIYILIFIVIIKQSKINKNFI